LDSCHQSADVGQAAINSFGCGYRKVVATPPSSCDELDGYSLLPMLLAGLVRADVNP
jgi:hypothetical protein